MITIRSHDLNLHDMRISFVWTLSSKGKKVSWSLEVGSNFCTFSCHISTIVNIWFIIINHTFNHRWCWCQTINHIPKPGKWEWCTLYFKRLYLYKVHFLFSCYQGGQVSWCNELPLFKFIGWCEAHNNINVHSSITTPQQLTLILKNTTTANIAIPHGNKKNSISWTGFCNCNVPQQIINEGKKKT